MSSYVAEYSAISEVFSLQSTVRLDAINKLKEVTSINFGLRTLPNTKTQPHCNTISQKRKCYILIEGAQNKYEGTSLRISSLFQTTKNYRRTLKLLSNLNYLEH